MRTRAGRGAKPAPSKTDRRDVVPPVESPSKRSPTLTRKTARSVSNISANSLEAAAEVYASFEHPLFMVFGLSPQFFQNLKKHHGKLPKERKPVVSSAPHESESPEDVSESDQDSDQEDSDLQDSLVAQPTLRGGRGRGRGGRARGGRVGRPRGKASGGRGAPARTSSPARACKSAASGFPLIEDDHDQPSNQSTPVPNAKPPRQFQEGENHHDNFNSEDDEDQAVEGANSDDISETMHPSQKNSTMPKGPVPSGLREATGEGASSSAPTRDHPGPKPTKKTAGKHAASKNSLLKGSAPQTTRNSGSTPAEPATPKLVDPEDDILSESDLPGPFIDGAPWPKEEDCEDRADFLLQTRFKPMTDIQDIIAPLTRFPASQRSTETLYALAENAQSILKAWQDEYLMLDARTAPHMHPPKKACNGGRIPTAPEIFEDMKEADLYGYVYDARKLPGCQDPWAQRPGAEKGGRRELRTRRTRDMLESAAASEEEEEVDQEGRPSKRQRKAPRKFDGTDTGTGANTPKKHSGWGGARKKGVSKFANPQGSATPEPEGKAAKRARTAATNLLHQRIQEMREKSVGGSSGEEGSSVMDVEEQPADHNPKRGRPAGSKNVARRSDYGIKKGPRKKTSAAPTPVPSAQGLNVPPPALASMSEGQGQFTIGDQPPAGMPILPSSSTEVMYHTTPRTLPSHEVPLVHPNESSTPDAYMSTVPLSQYAGGYMEDPSAASGSRSKPPARNDKQSQSMNVWWPERKVRKRGQDDRNGTPAKTSNSRSNSTSRSGPRSSLGSAAGVTPQPPSSEAQHLSPAHSLQYTNHHAPPEAYLGHFSQSPNHAQHYMYVPGPQAPHHMMMQYSPLAALPSGPFPSYPNPHASHIQPHPSTGYSARALAPAPMPPQHHASYPSPYGPQSPAPAPSKRSQPSGEQPRNGPPPLAPAPPQHYSPYPPIGGGPSVGPGPGMERQFKVMVPGPTGERRESR